jgi:hypothetical protein
MTEFVDALPGHGNTKYADFYAFLDANPGRWAVHPGEFANRNSAGGAVARLKSRGYDATIRAGVLYARKPA